MYKVSESTQRKRQCQTISGIRRESLSQMRDAGMAAIEKPSSRGGLPVVELVGCSAFRFDRWVASVALSGLILLMHGMQSPKWNSGFKDSRHRDESISGTCLGQDSPKVRKPLIVRQVSQTKFFAFVAPLLVVVGHIGMCMWGAYRHSPTMDEPAYLVAGISHWTFSRFDLCRVSPHLVRVVAAIPVRWANPNLDFKNYFVADGVRLEHQVGNDFVVANGNRSLWLFTLGRWGCLPFTILGAFVSYRWAKELFGPLSAMTSLLLWCFSPSILAHAQLLTPDIGVTSLCLASCYAFWKWSKTPSWKTASISGIVLGLAVLAKTNAIAIYPAISLGVFIHACWQGHMRSRVKFFQVCGAFVISLYVINFGYGFDGTFRSLGSYRFYSETLGSPGSEAIGGNRFQGSAFGSIPVPLPASFVEGFDLQRRDFENTRAKRKTYLRGNWYDHSWWWYYIYLVGVKSPFGTCILVIIGIAQILQSQRRLEVLCYVAMPGVSLFALPCSQTGFGASLRYILPAIPFAIIVASAAADSAGRTRTFVVIALLVSSLCSSVCAFPHSLSYFNELAGGPQNGHYHLLDGNCDWGQDLLFVRDWIENHPDRIPVRYAWWGVEPSNYGIEVKRDEIDEQAPIPSGWYLVSVNHLRSEYRTGRPELVQFLLREPAGRVGYSTNIYYVPTE